MNRLTLTLAAALCLIALLLWLLFAPPAESPESATGQNNAAPGAAAATPVTAAGTPELGAMRREPATKTPEDGSAGADSRSRYSVRGTLRAKSVAGRQVPFDDAEIEAYAGTPEDLQPEFSQFLDVMGDGASIQQFKMKARGTPVVTAAVDASGSFELSVPAQHPHLRLKLDHRYYALPKLQIVHRESGQSGVELRSLDTVLGGHVLGRVAGAALAPGTEIDLVGDPDPMAVLREPQSFTATIMRGGSSKTTVRGDGRFEFRAVMASPGLRASARTESVIAKSGSFALGAGETREIVLRTVPSGRLDVQVVQARDGAPIVGASVKVVPLGVRGDISRVNATQWETTGEGGTCGLTVLPVGRYRVTAQHEHYRPASLEAGVDVSGGEPVVLQLRDGTTISGRVVDADGAPIAEAHVATLPKMEIPMFGDTAQMVGADVMARAAKKSSYISDEDGRFEIRGVEPDATLHVAAIHADFAAGLAKDVESGARDVEVVLEQQAELSGRCVDPSGAPIPQFEVRTVVKLALFLDRPTKVARFRDREDGQFELSGIPPKPCTLEVSAPNHGKFTKSLKLGAGDRVDIGEIVLQPSAVLRGRVLDPDGVPVAAATVRRDRGGVMNNPIAAAFFNREAAASTDSQGRYELTDVSPGKLRVLAQHADFASARSNRIEVAAGSIVEDVDLQLSAGGRIEGRLLLPLGRDTEGWEIMATREPQSSFRSTSAETDGTFTIEGLDAGGYTVQAMDMRSLQNTTESLKVDEQMGGTPDVMGMIRELQDLTVNARVRVRDGETTEVELDASDFDADGTRLVCEITIGTRPLREGIVEVTALRGEQNALTQAFVQDGRIEVHRLQPGAVRLQLRGGLTLSPIGTPKTVEIPEGESQVDVRWELPGGRIAGRVVDAQSGAPVVGGAVKLLRAESAGEPIDFGFGLSGTDGSFAFEGLSEGSFILVSDSLWAGAGSDRVARLEGLRLDAGSSIEDLELRVRPGAGVALEVSDPLGRPAAGTLVLAVDEAGRPIGSLPVARTNADGRAWIAGLPDGRLRIVARNSRFAPAASPLRNVTANATTTFTIQLQRGTDVELEIHDASGEPLAGASIAVRFGDLPWIPTSLFDTAHGARVSLGPLPRGNCEFRVQHARLAYAVTRNIPGGARAALVLAPPQD